MEAPTTGGKSKRTRQPCRLKSNMHSLNSWAKRWGLWAVDELIPGVHAKQQIAHFDWHETFDLSQLQFKLNSFLSPYIAINSIREIKPEIHARFDAIERSYEYYVGLKKSPFDQGYSYYFPKQIDIETMNEAAATLLGSHDFESFSKVKTEVNNFICNIVSANWQSENDSLVFHVTANRFLRGMVRAMVGTLLEVGLGKLTVEEFTQIIEQKDRRAAGRAVPAKGLFLSKVTYPSSIYIN